MKKNSLAILLLIAIPALSSEADDSHHWRGVDLSYVNELEECSAEYSDANGWRDPYRIMATAGANIVRLRLWQVLSEGNCIDSYRDRTTNMQYSAADCTRGEVR